MTERAFIIMPFDPAFNDVHAAIKEALREVGDRVEATRLDEVRAAGNITEDMVSGLRECTVCIADVTGRNANVMWEVGYAAALQKPTLVLQEGIESLPFDISQLRVLRYDRADLATTLREPLVQALTQTLRRYAAVAVRRPPQGIKAVAVTGTRGAANSRSTRARIEQVLHPYLETGCQWYVGGQGTVDETALQVLLDAGEANITVVGYNRFDLSGAQLAALETHPAVSFIDSRDEQMPAVADAASPRDVVFATRAQIVVVFWDGLSRNSGRLIEWLTAHGKDHVIGFVPPA
jgi:hypothetical protein